jgi:uncharacterized repeat protein (TIGR03803 family)
VALSLEILMKALLWTPAVALGWSLVRWRKTLVSYCVLSATFMAVLLIANITQAESGRKLLHAFEFSRGGNTPLAPMIFDTAGNLYGTTYDGGPSNLGVVFELSSGLDGRVQETVLHAFTGPDGANPRGNLVIDAAGNLYGTTESGGSTGCVSFTGLSCGVVFQLAHSEKGWTETVLHSFTENYNHDGYQPFGGLVSDAKGNLYGATQGGGSFGEGGTVFELTLTQGVWSYSVIYDFGNQDLAAGPTAPLAIDANGNLYGTASGDDRENWGAVFELTQTPVGWNETLLYVFTGVQDGGGPGGSLVIDNAGNLYGTAAYGGANEYGVVFKLTPLSGGGWTESVLHSFQGADGRQPSGGLIADASGTLYGTTYLGGDPCDILGYGCGTVFRLNLSGLTVLHRFTGGNDAEYPIAPLTIDAAGNLYGTTEGDYQFSTAFQLAPMPDGGVKETVIHTFADADGQVPQGTLSLDMLGNPYGTTELGGSHSVGSVFELARSLSGAWTEKVIYSFTGEPGGNNPRAGGAEPTGGLLFDTAGNIFGTAFAGGNPTCQGQTCGTVFELTPTSGGWTETTLYAFKGGSDGGYPNGGLVSDSEGNLFGTSGGGAYGYGTVFELTPGLNGWTETVIYAFRGQGDGVRPLAGLIFDGSGNLYGTTSAGGTGQCADGCGTVFELVRASGWTEQVLYKFKGSQGDGQVPFASLIFDAAGNLYGTTGQGGAGAGGTVFELAPSDDGQWSESVLYGFSGPDGKQPIGGVTFDAAGNLYGTTVIGGSGSCSNGNQQDAGCGVVFKLTPTGDGKWRESGLYSFTGGTDGANPEASLVLDSLGNFYGTAQDGGAGCGGVFGFTP